MDPRDPLSRGRTSIALDMKNPDAVATARDLCKSADGIIEGFRPGVMERLGLGPDVLLADNPKLVYGRMTGWGQFRSEEHTSELPSPMRSSYAVLCLKKIKSRPHY